MIDVTGTHIAPAAALAWILFAPLPAPVSVCSGMAAFFLAQTICLLGQEDGHDDADACAAGAAAFAIATILCIYAL